LYLQAAIFYSSTRHDPSAALGRIGLALAVEPRHHRLDDLDSGHIFNIMANTERLMGRAADARAHYRRAIELLTTQLGPRHPSVPAIVGNLGAIEFDLGNYEAAAGFFERNLEEAVEAFGAESDSALVPAINLAWARLQTGRIAEARELADRSVHLAEK